MKYIVKQTFETLGEAQETKHATLVEARNEAKTFKKELAAWIMQVSETPVVKPSQRSGGSHENDAWNTANELAGVEYDERGERSGPVKYNQAAADYLAEKAVKIFEIDEDGEETVVTS